MKQTVENWFHQLPATAGLLACGVRFPDCQCLSRSQSPDLPLSRLEAAWHHLAETLVAIRQHRIFPMRLRWRYERGDLHFAIRNDGILLGLFATEELATEFIAGIVEEFLQLR